MQDCRILHRFHPYFGGVFFRDGFMNKSPAVLLYTSDFLTGVSFFNWEDRGKYITLLCEQHQHGSIPEDYLISLCGSLDSPVAKKFLKDKDGGYYNQRMRLECIKRGDFVASRKGNGQLGGRPQKNKKGKINE